MDLLNMFRIFLKKLYLSNLYTDCYKITLKTWGEVIYDENYKGLKKRKLYIPKQYIKEAYNKVYEHYISLSDIDEANEIRKIEQKIAKKHLNIFLLKICYMCLPISDTENIRLLASRLGYRDKEKDKLIKHIEMGIGLQNAELIGYLKEKDEILSKTKKTGEKDSWKTIYANLASLSKAGFEVDINMPLAQYISSIGLSNRLAESIKAPKK